MPYGVITDFGNPISWKENSEGCWICSSHKFAYVRFENKPRLIYRLVWELCNEREIPRGMLIMHLCDNRMCINPSHLRLGTQKDNMKDCINKGRFVYLKIRKGERHPNHRLTEKQVDEIRQRSELPRRELARMYGVASSTIQAVISKTNWGWK